MKPRKRTALGIDIGGRCIRAALAEKTSQGVRVLASVSADLGVDQRQEPGWQSRAISQIVGELGGRVRMRGVQGAVAMSGGSIVMRLLDLPKPMPTNVSEFVAGELKQCVALSGRDTASDFCGIPTTGGSRKRLLAVAADADHVGEIIRTCGATGIAVDSIEPAVLAYARVVLTAEKGALQGGNTVIAVLGAHHLIACLFCKGTLDFVRVREVPVALDGPGPLGAWLSDELNAILRYYRTGARSRGAEFQIHLVIHEAAYAKDEIAPFLALEGPSQSPVVVDCREPDGISSGSRTDSSHPASALAVGAALRLLNEGDEPHINLMPREVAQARASSMGLLVLANAAAVALIAVFLITQFLARTTHAMHERIERTRLAGQLYTMPAAVQEDKHLDREIAHLQEQLNRLQSARTGGEVSWPVALDAIRQATPAAVWITHMACPDRRTVSLKGTAETYGQAKAFVQNLDGREPFESAWLMHVQRRRDDNTVVEFEIKCMVRPTNQERHGNHQS
jgi:Tfp pilus assembly protein PilN